MGLSNMKSLILCVLIIHMVALNHGVTANNKFIDPGVLDPCQRPGGPHPGCHPNNNNGEPKPANPYSRGCSKVTRCRSDPQ
ncbi:protein RALF-like 10 [Rosa rugosa]|uniref:protein RALF-like 10 n=1 Tax=Rosa rugosa TaxID=74645 RepID=UPI002B40592A|nr:protein RALF-like 10 [Rosa rugosa]